MNFLGILGAFIKFKNVALELLLFRSLLEFLNRIHFLTFWTFVSWHSSLAILSTLYTRKFTFFPIFNEFYKTNYQATRYEKKSI